MLDVLLRRLPAATAPLLLVALIAAARPAHASWPGTSSNLAVNIMPGAQNYKMTLPDGAGGLFVAWSDTRFVVSDVYVQHVTAAGNLTWNANGLIACAASGRQEQPVLCSD